MTYEEIARVLDCSVGTVMSRLHYARAKLKEALKGFREG
jgi:DNA-directed RNA polymerase specialized sigma24 family protein